MAEPTPLQPGSVPSVQVNLHELARLLRASRHLDPNAQQELADLLGELARALEASPSAQSAQLATTAEHLVRALHEQHQAGLLVAGKRRLEEAAAQAEAKAPVVTEVVRRLIDALAGLGI